MGSPSWLFDLGLENPSTDEFLARPDLRQIATFFSGILFAASSYYFLHSTTLASILSYFRRKKSRRSNASLNMGQDSLSKTSTSLSNRTDPLSLVFLLNIVYVTTAATQMGSLLSFSSANGAVPCTFLMAWGALGSQTIRLIGLLKMTVHLRERGAANWEKYALWGALLLLTTVMFLTTAVTTAVLRPIPYIESFSLCYMRHFLLGSAVTRGLNLGIELVILARLISLLFPWIPAADAKMQVARDIQIHRVLSLILLDGATIYPSLFPTSLVADFVPFSAASILVLVAFNYNTIPRQSLVSSIFNANPPSLPQSIRIPTPNFSPFLDLQASTPSSKEISVMDFTLDRRSGRSVLIFQEKEQPHPFASGSLSAVSHSPRHWRSPNRAAISLIEQSGSLSDSVRNAVITTANKARFYSADNPVLMMTDALQAPSPGDEFTTRQRSVAAPNGSPRRSFLPTLRSASNGSRDLPTGSRVGRQILPQQTDVAAQMTASQRPFFRGHGSLPSQGSIVLQEKTMSPTPPPPPRTQRVLYQDPHPMKILSEENNTRPSTADSAIVFGSDILLRTQDDVMRMRKDIMEGGSNRTGAGSAGHGSRRTDSSSLGERPHRNSGLSLQIVNPSHHSFGASTSEAQLGTMMRPLSGQGQALVDTDTLAVSAEGVPSPTYTQASPLSRSASNAHKRPTFGESLFEGFQEGLARLEDPQPSGHPEDPSYLGALIHQDERDSRPSSLQFVTGAELHPTTIGDNQQAGKQREGSQKGSMT